MKVNPESGHQDRLSNGGSSQRASKGLRIPKKKIIIAVVIIFSLAVLAVNIGAATAVLAVLARHKGDDRIDPIVSTTDAQEAVSATSVHTTVCSSIDDDSVEFEGALNLTIVTSEINNCAVIRGFNSFTADKTYFIAVTGEVVYVYSVLGDGTMEIVQNVTLNGYNFHEYSQPVDTFELEGEHFLFINSDWSGNPYSSHIYKWNGEKIVENDVINYEPSVYDSEFSAGWSFIECGLQGQTFLANALHSELDLVEYENTFIYVYDGRKFNFLQYLETETNTVDVEFFQPRDTELYLCLGSGHSPSTLFTSYVYKYNPVESKFARHQTLPVTGVTSDLLLFDIGDKTFLMQTLYDNQDFSYDASSPLYVWNPATANFETHQFFNTSRGKAACHYRHCNQHFLVIVMERSDAIVYYLKGDYFVEYQILPVYSGIPLYACHVFYANGVQYLAVDKMVYKLVQIDD